MEKLEALAKNIKILELPGLLNKELWEYKAEGRANIVVAYTGPEVKYNGVVLRVKKITLAASAAAVSTTLSQEKRVKPVEPSESMEPMDFVFENENTEKVIEKEVKNQIEKEEEEKTKDSIEKKIDIEKETKKKTETIDRLQIYNLLYSNFILDHFLGTNYSGVNALLRLNSTFINCLNQHIYNQRPVARREVDLIDPEQSFGTLSLDYTKVKRTQMFISASIYDHAAFLSPTELAQYQNKYPLLTNSYDSLMQSTTPPLYTEPLPMYTEPSVLPYTTTSSSSKNQDHTLLLNNKKNQQNFEHYQKNLLLTTQNKNNENNNSQDPIIHSEEMITNDENKTNSSLNINLPMESTTTLIPSLSLTSGNPGHMDHDKLPSPMIRVSSQYLKKNHSKNRLNSAGDISSTMDTNLGAFGIAIPEPETIAIELKPKWGFKPKPPVSSSSSTRHSTSASSAATTAFKMKNLPKYKYCRFCLHYLYKNKKKIKEAAAKGTSYPIDHFCPLDLFSGNDVRIRQAIQDLYNNPGNNLKIFINGKQFNLNALKQDTTTTTPGKMTNEKKSNPSRSHDQIHNNEWWENNQSHEVNGETLKKRRLNPGNTDFEKKNTEFQTKEERYTTSPPTSLPQNLSNGSSDAVDETSSKVCFDHSSLMECSDTLPLHSTSHHDKNGTTTILPTMTPQNSINENTNHPKMKKQKTEQEKSQKYLLRLAHFFGCEKENLKSTFCHFFSQLIIQESDLFHRLKFHQRNLDNNGIEKIYEYFISLFRDKVSLKSDMMSNLLRYNGK